MPPQFFGKSCMMKRWNVLSEAEQQYAMLMARQELNIPQPNYLFIRAEGNVEKLFSKASSLCPPNTAGGKEGYLNIKSIPKTIFFLYEVPCLSICANMQIAMSSDVLVQPAMPLLLSNCTQATENLFGYYGTVWQQKKN